MRKAFRIDSVEALRHQGLKELGNGKGGGEPHRFTTGLQTETPDFSMTAPPRQPLRPRCRAKSLPPKAEEG